MRVKVLLLVLLIGLAGVIGLPRLSHAEKARTNQTAKVTNRPGEQGKVLVKLKEGQTVTIVAKEGRWLKVRASGRTGYLPRTVVDMADADDGIQRNTRRRAFVDGRSKKRGFGGADTAPEDRIGADATGDTVTTAEDDEDDADDAGADDDEDPIESSGGEDGDDGDDDGDADDDDEEILDDRRKARVGSRTVAYMDPDDESEEAFTARPSDLLFIESTDGAWTEVSVEEGDIGWVRSAELELEERGGGKSGPAAIAVRARVGVTIFRQVVSSAGGAQAWPDAYTVGSSAATVAVGGSYLMPYKKKFVVGGELAYDIAKAVPGIAFDPDGGGPNGGPMASSTTGITMHNFNLRGVFGYDFKKPSGMMVSGRLGYHYESFLVADYADLTKNTARLPSEVIKGPTIGAGFTIPRLTSKIGLGFNLDAMVVGASVTQTENLEQGQDPTAKRISFGTAFTYRWKPAIDIQAAYDLNYASLAFGAPVPTSMRGQTGTSAARKDLHHTVTIGVAKAF